MEDQGTDRTQQCLHFASSCDGTGQPKKGTDRTHKTLSPSEVFDGRRGSIAGENLCEAMVIRFSEPRSIFRSNFNGRERPGVVHPEAQPRRGWQQFLRPRCSRSNEVIDAGGVQSLHPHGEDQIESELELYHGRSQL